MLKNLALTRLTWAMHLTMRTGMEIRRALSLSFKAANFAPISDHLPQILGTVERGGNLTDAFLDANCFDTDLVTAVESGEQSGSLPELMHRLSEQYMDESLLKLKVLSVAGGFAVYGCIAAVIVFMIFRLAMFYIGILNDAAGL